MFLVPSVEIVDKVGTMLKETEENLDALEELLKDRNLKMQMDDYSNKVKFLQEEKMKDFQQLKSES